MKLHAIVATLEGCPFAVLDDADRLDGVLTEAVSAGGFQELHRHVHRFTPHGVTATVVLGESHIAIHTWPERGVLLLDVASCSGEVATRAAFDCILERVPHAAVRRDLLAYDVGTFESRVG